MPPSTPDFVQLALLIRRGQLKLVDVPEAHRQTVWSVLHRLTDAQEALIAHRQVAPRRFLGRERVFTRASS